MCAVPNGRGGVAQNKTEKYLLQNDGVDSRPYGYQRVKNYKPNQKLVKTSELAKKLTSKEKTPSVPKAPTPKGQTPTRGPVKKSKRSSSGTATGSEAAFGGSSGSRKLKIPTSSGINIPV